MRHRVSIRTHYAVFFTENKRFRSLEITVWFVPSLFENAVAVALVGLFLGPIYPIVMRVTGRLIPYSLVGGSVGWVTGFGQTGSAIVPFITGTMASKFGVQSLQPL